MRNYDGRSGAGRGFVRGNISRYPVELEIVVGKDLFQPGECRCRLAELAWCLTLDQYPSDSEIGQLRRTPAGKQHILDLGGPGSFTADSTTGNHQLAGLQHVEG